MPGSINDIDLDHLIPFSMPDLNRRILCQDGDTPLSFEIIRVHDPFDNLLVLAKNQRLFKQPIHQSGFSMVNMGDNRDIA